MEKVEPVDVTADDESVAAAPPSVGERPEPVVEVTSTSPAVAPPLHVSTDLRRPLAVGGEAGLDLAGHGVSVVQGG